MIQSVAILIHRCFLLHWKFCFAAQNNSEFDLAFYLQSPCFLINDFVFLFVFSHFFEDSQVFD